jgi:mannose-6-phosphate isomerase
MWMGAHPRAPSSVLNHGEWQRLDLLIKSSPKRMLGQRVQEQFKQLPFLFKVLAAAEPLSLQAHPNLEQARRGFAAENEKGIPLGALDRSFKDDNHKPELLCALTPFDALCGFRPVPHALELLQGLGNPRLAPFIEPLQAAVNGTLSESSALALTFGGLMRAPKSVQAELVETTLPAIHGRNKDTRFEASLGCAEALAKHYPNDVGVVTSLMLNFVSLVPGEALYLPAGNLHAYVSGMGLELMANSDNVLRGGLTPKHVDVEALLDVLDFKSIHVDKRMPREVAEGQTRYETSAREFELWKLELGARPRSIAASDGPEILIATEGKAVYQTSRYFVELLPGESAFQKARGKAYKLTGPGTVYRATVPTTGAGVTP